MSRAAIDDQKDFAPGVLDQSVPEFDQVFDEGNRVVADGS
jgi:hypothetical protein